MAIVGHHSVESYELQGNVIAGLATPSRGARQIEVWHTSMAPGAATPPHVHAGEEVVVVLSGWGEVQIGDVVTPFEGPCTLIAPAGVSHQIINTGAEPLTGVAMMPLGSSITTPDGVELPLPWRG